MKNLILPFAFIFLTYFAIGQSATDIDNNEYQTKKFGNQIWMTKNLNVSHFRNGDVIPEIKTTGDWDKAYKEEKPGWSYYNNDPSNGKKYGKLYNWYAVNDSRGLAPEGWHVPSNKEWNMLIASVGGQNAAFSKLTSSAGFSALPGGERYFEDCAFHKANEIGFWWTSSKADTYNAWYHALHFGYKQVGNDNGGMNTGFSVRCIKD